MNGTPAAAVMARSRSAWRSALSRLSITQGPPMNASGAPPPMRDRPDPRGAGGHGRHLALDHLETAEQRCFATRPPAAPARRG